MRQVIQAKMSHSFREAMGTIKLSNAKSAMALQIRMQRETQEALLGAALHSAGVAASAWEHEKAALERE